MGSMGVRLPPWRCWGWFWGSEGHVRWAAALVLLLGAGACPLWAQERPLVYNRDIRPILAENCFACHGPDRAARKAHLRLDQREAAVEKGAIVPGQPEKSELVRRIYASDPHEVMPPPKTKKRLTAQQKEMLRRWIAQGAVYQPHWSFLPPQRPPLPSIRRTDWVRNPIDYFILAKLEEVELAPAPEADRRTLARRLSLDLTGLPPDPALVEAFVADPAPDAYERLVERLLASPHWGEHRARYWLDAARYADTHGIHFDNYREIWAYRDWVIDAFNQNMPFDRFTIEQLAGDLLPHPTLEQLIATGFNRCNITTNEGGVIPEEYLVLYCRDRTETTARVWLGLTANCAVCHDHKYDPITQKDFYSLSAFFNNTTQPAMDGNIKDTPPVIPVPRREDRPRWQALQKELAQVRQELAARKEAAQSAFLQWLQTAQPASLTAQLPRQDLHLHLPLNEGQGNTVTFQLAGQLQQQTLAGGFDWDQGVLAARALRLQAGPPLSLPTAGDWDKEQAFTVAAWVRLPSPNSSGALLARMDDQNGFRGWDLWVENNRVGMHLIHTWPEDALKVLSKTPLTPNQWHQVLICYDGSGKAAGVQIYVDGVRQAGRQVFRDQLRQSTRTAVPLTLGQRHTTSRVIGAALQEVRLYSRALAAEEIATLYQGSRAAWLVQKEKRTPAETDELYGWWLGHHDPIGRQLVQRQRGLEQEEATIKARGTVAHIMQEKPGLPFAYVLFRGDYDKRREKVTPNTFHALPPMPADLPRNRLGLAQWLLRPENPLTARVTVNRFWQEIFGTGLVRTAGDFGVAGELPSHPELLDWLAVEFRESGWDVKHLFRLIVTSATYRQAVQITPQRLEKDPQNRLLSRGPRFRMDAEMVRDYALAASGLLVRRLGGPSVKPYQPPGVWEAVAMIGSNTRDYVQDHGAALYRRSLYTFWKRAAPPPSMEIFNAPSREVCTVQRERTNTPLQALVTLNDPQFVEAARCLAQLTLRQGGASDESRCDFLARRVLCRPWRAEELPIVRASLQDLLAYYRSHPEDARQLLPVGESPVDAGLDPATLAAWTMLANEVFNLDEVLNK